MKKLVLATLLAISPSVCLAGNIVLSGHKKKPTPELLSRKFAASYEYAYGKVSTLARKISEANLGQAVLFLFDSALLVCDFAEQLEHLIENWQQQGGDESSALEFRSRLELIYKNKYLAREFRDALAVYLES